MLKQEQLLDKQKITHLHKLELKSGTREIIHLIHVRYIFKVQLQGIHYEFYQIKHETDQVITLPVKNLVYQNQAIYSLFVCDPLTLFFCVY